MGLFWDLLNGHLDSITRITHIFCWDLNYWWLRDQRFFVSNIIGLRRITHGPLKGNARYVFHRKLKAFNNNTKLWVKSNMCRVESKVKSLKGSLIIEVEEEKGFSRSQNLQRSTRYTLNCTRNYVSKKLYEVKRIGVCNGEEEINALNFSIGWCLRGLC